LLRSYVAAAIGRGSPPALGFNGKKKGGEEYVVEHPRERLLAAFDDTTDRFHHLVAQLSAAEAETACYPPGNIRSVQTFVGLRLCELVVHGWDTRSRLEPAASLSSASAAVLVGW
jgi:hypothetical protein